MVAELTTLPDSAEYDLKVNQSFHVLTNEFENHPGYRNVSPIMLNVILDISLIARCVGSSALVLVYIVCQVENTSDLAKEVLIRDSQLETIK